MTTNTEEKKPVSAASAVEQARAAVEKAAAGLADEIGKGLDVPAMRREILALLQKQQTEVVWKVLGLENRWGGKWEVDHCNGRTHPIGEFLATEVGDSIRDWLKGAVEQTLNDTNAKKMVEKAIASEVGGLMDRRVRDLVETGIRQLAHDVALMEVNKVREEVGLQPVTKLETRW